MLAAENNSHSAHFKIGYSNCVPQKGSIISIHSSDQAYSNTHNHTGQRDGCHIQSCDLEPHPPGVFVGAVGKEVHPGELRCDLSQKQTKVDDQ